MAEFADAVTPQQAIRVPVDVVAVDPGERRVERVSDAPQCGSGPCPRVARRCHRSLLGCRDQVKSEPPSTLTFAPVIYELRREAKNAATGPISSGNLARGRRGGGPK